MVMADRSRVDAKVKILIDLLAVGWFIINNVLSGEVDACLRGCFQAAGQRVFETQMQYYAFFPMLATFSVQSFTILCVLVILSAKNARRTIFLVNFANKKTIT